MNRKTLVIPLAILLLVPLALFQPEEAFATVTVDTDEISQSNFGGATDDPNIITGHQIDAGSDIVLVVMVCVESGDDLGDTTGDISWTGDGGHDLIQAVELQAQVGAEIWYVAIGDLASDQSGNIEINNPTNKKMNAGAIAFFGVVQTGIIDAFDSDSGTNDGAISLVTSDDNSMSAEVFCHENGTNTASEDGQIEHWDDDADVGGSGFTDLLGVAATYDQDIDAQSNGKKYSYVGIAMTEASGGAPIYVVDLLDVYESESTTLGTGNIVCLNIDLEIADECEVHLIVGHIYRFEVEVDETAGVAGSPTTLDIDSSIADYDVFGNIVVGQIIDSGCSTNTDWIESIVSTDVRASSGTTCAINSSSVEFWIIIRINSDAGSGAQPTATFTIDDGTVSDVSTTTTFTVDNSG